MVPEDVPGDDQPQAAILLEDEPGDVDAEAPVAHDNFGASKACSSFLQDLLACIRSVVAFLPYSDCNARGLRQRNQVADVLAFRCTSVNFPHSVIVRTNNQ